MKIKSFDLKKDILIIAEVGNNHEGDVSVARELVHKAKECGVGAVKFQTFKTERYVSGSDAERFKRLQSFELSEKDFTGLSELAHELGLLFISTPLDIQSARFLNGIVDAFKIASGDNNFYPLMDEVCRTGKPVIVSSGATDLSQILQFKTHMELQWEKSRIRQQVAILHCVTSYPVPYEQANLLSIPYLYQELGGIVGYSDHTMGIEASYLSAALGARIIEKHFTLDKNYSSFRDHQISADPNDMKQLVEQIRRLRPLLGEVNKKIQPCEEALIPLIRRSVTAERDLAAGHRITLDDLMWLRPGNGLAPGNEEKLIGKQLKGPKKFGELIGIDDLE